MLAEDLGITSVQDVVENQFGIEGNERGDEYDILCPNPEHQDRNIGNCSVNLTTGLWKCLACGKAGDLLSLGVLLLDVSRDEVERLVRPGTVESLQVIVQRRLMEATARPRRETQQHALPGPYEDGPLDSLHERGFTQETCERWGVRFVEHEELPGKKGTPFNIYNTVAIPIRDEHHRLLAWCYRRTQRSPEWQPRYLYTPNVDISELWFGLQHHAHERDVVITEGAMDAMWFDQCGFPALALLGSSMGERKIRWLQRYHSITLFCDRDAGGVSAVQRIGGVLGSRLPVKVVRYPTWVATKERGKVDPQDLHPVDVEILLARAQPWSTWLRQNVLLRAT